MEKTPTIRLDGKQLEHSFSSAITVKELLTWVRNEAETERKRIFQCIIDSELLTVDNSMTLLPLPISECKTITLLSIDPYHVALDSISYLQEVLLKLEKQVGQIIETSDRLIHNEIQLFQSIGKTMIAFHNELEDIRRLVGWDFGLMVFDFDPMLDHCLKWQETAEILLLSDESDLSRYPTFLDKTVEPLYQHWKQYLTQLEQVVLTTLQND